MWFLTIDAVETRSALVSAIAAVAAVTVAVTVVWRHSDATDVPAIAIVRMAAAIGIENRTIAVLSCRSAAPVCARCGIVRVTGLMAGKRDAAAVTNW